MFNTAKILDKTLVRYRIITTEIRTESRESVEVYGLEVIYFGKICRFAEIEDISCRKKDVERLIEMLVMEDVEPDQLMYIVEDYIVQLYDAV